MTGACAICGGRGCSACNPPPEAPSACPICGAPLKVNVFPTRIKALCPLHGDVGKEGLGKGEQRAEEA